eukprot:1739120-Pleurochrysis_carterae.AAC.2
MAVKCGSHARHEATVDALSELQTGCARAPLHAAAGALAQRGVRGGVGGGDGGGGGRAHARAAANPRQRQVSRAHARAALWRFCAWSCCQVHALACYLEHLGDSHSLLYDAMICAPMPL